MRMLRRFSDLPMPMMMAAFHRHMNLPRSMFHLSVLVVVVTSHLPPSVAVVVVVVLVCPSRSEQT